MYYKTDVIRKFVKIVANSRVGTSIFGKTEYIKINIKIFQ